MAWKSDRGVGRLTVHSLTIYALGLGCLASTFGPRRLPQEILGASCTPRVLLRIEYFCRVDEASEREIDLDVETAENIDFAVEHCDATVRSRLHMKKYTSSIARTVMVLALTRAMSLDRHYNSDSV